jgi:hypothetical protein
MITRKFLKSLFDTVDLFGVPITLMHKGKHKFNTIYGTCYTIVAAILLILFIVYQAIHI